MDIVQEYIKQQLNETPVWYSATLITQATVQGTNNVINLNFVNEKVALIICQNIWVCYNSGIGSVQISDTYGQKIFSTPVAPGTDTQVMGMFDFPFIQNGAAIALSASNVNFQFSIFYQLVYFYNEKA